MYQSRINKDVTIIGTISLILAICLSVIFSFATMRNNVDITLILALIASLAFYGTTLTMITFAFPKDKGGIPILTPKDYIDESFIFCPIKEEYGFWLSTIDNFERVTVAVSQLDFVPKDRESIQASLEKSIKEEKRLKIMAYGCNVGKGYIFVLTDPKNQKKPLGKKENSFEGIENPDN